MKQREKIVPKASGTVLEIGIGTGLFYDPLLCARINAEVSAYLQRNSMQSISELIGSLQLPGMEPGCG